MTGYSEINDKGHINNKNLQDVVKAICRGKLIALKCSL